MPEQHKSYSPKERHKHELPGMKYYIILVSFFQLHPSDKALICPILRIFFTGQINSSCSCSENLSPKSSPRRAGINPGPLFHVQTTSTSTVPHRLTFTTPAPDWPDDWVSPSGTGARHYSSNRRWLQTGVSAAAQTPRRWAASEAVGGRRWAVGGGGEIHGVFREADRLHLISSAHCSWADASSIITVTRAFIRVWSGQI